ncbi:cytochrome P450 monooxygenase [Fomitiporia mediterranea MF3/22]|uniref:Cytochrome P450 monooxygenase n=1 Tax=Fomitiporia mediterranea (strain MF3/22) TaxID=694068 RepID=R7SGX9_FOMME|nr:cytochrome P450 monooxygenase [Fomitiporia mediterranea MF3/22]EJC97665.1 cytochrome P450 monooxygenase [Fomitiporia mediterranea MF3/22]
MILIILRVFVDIGYRIWLFLPWIFLVVHLIPYLVDRYHIRRNGITGPSLARFSDAWLGWVVANGRQSEVVHEMHKKFGPVVRLAPNHVSISDPGALHVIYGHGSGLLKSGYYEPFTAVRPSIFSTRSREVHSKKRKIISHVFSQKSVLEFEPFVHLHLAELFEHWDKMCDGGKEGLSGTESEGGWKRRGGQAWFDIMPWFNYLAFDIIGDLAFGSPFGMVRNAKDAAPIAVDRKSAMAQYGPVITDNRGLEKPVIDVREVHAISVLENRMRLSAQMGVLPAWWRPIVRQLPRFAQGVQNSKDLVDLAVAAVAKRMAYPTQRDDILSKLQQSRDEYGRPLTQEDLTTDAITQLVAGSDTISISSCGIAYHLAANPDVQSKLQKEIDDALGGFDDPMVTYAQIKHLQYLEAVINEGLRVHPTPGLGLPRVVPEGGLNVCGKWFPEGTILSVPTYTIHRNTGVWGEDANVFRPERWFEGDQAAMQKVFNAFSFGPRACIGRNLAMMELYIIIASIFHRYELILEEPNKPLEIHEAFMRKPVACHVGLKRRGA